MAEEPTYGPIRDLDYQTDITQLTLPVYLHGYAAKILRDLRLKASLYDGVTAQLFKVDRTGGRCETCHDSLTGARLFTSCTVCGGTGYEIGYVYSGEFKIYIQIENKEALETYAGNTDSLGGQRTTVMFFGLPLLVDTDLLLLKDTNVIYKIEDHEPQIASLHGHVLVQTVACSRLTPGCQEYKALALVETPVPEDLGELG